MDILSQVAKTKIIVPRKRPDLLSRQRLLDLLYDLLDHKLIVLTAPPGYGKTSLLVDMAHQLELPVCWYALDPLDQEPKRFLGHFIASIAHKFSGFGEQSLALLADDQKSVDIDRLIPVIVNEIFDQIPEYFVIVLDDYHLIDPCDEINYFINQFTQLVSENCHTVISSRRMLVLPDITLMTVRSQVAGLGLEELAFQPSEIQSLILQNYHSVMSITEAEALAKETEGWITGLLLSSVVHRQHNMTDRLRTARISGVGLYDYLAEQVLNQQPKPVREFLLWTSLFEEFDAALCEAVLETTNNWGYLIDTVIQHNLFVLRVDNEQGVWLRYHHLFRDFLQNRLAQEQPETKDHILYQLAAYYADRSNWSKAYHLYRRLDNSEAVVALIEKAGLDMIQTGSLSSLIKWINELPDSFQTRPYIMALHGSALGMLGEVQRGKQLLDKAECLIRKLKDVNMLARVLIWQSGTYRFLSEYQAALTCIDEALELIPAGERMCAEALRVKGATLYQSGLFQEAIACWESALATYHTVNHNVAVLYMDLGNAYMAIGSLRSAETNFNNARVYWHQRHNLTWQCNLLNNLGVLYYLRGDYELAGQTLEGAISLARQSGYRYIEALALVSLAEVHRDLEDWPAGLQAYLQAELIAREIDSHFLLFYIDLGRAIIARSRGELQQADKFLSAAAEQAASNHDKGLICLETGLHSLLSKKPKTAAAVFEEAEHHFDPDSHEAIRTRLYLAVAYHQIGQSTVGSAYLDEVLTAASKLETDHFLVVAATGIEPVLKSIGADSRINGLHEKIKRQRQQVIFLRRKLRRQIVTIPSSPPTLKIRALGAAEVKLDDKIISNADWKVKLARDLFFYILKYRDGVNKDTAGDAFWPDKTTGQMNLQFKNTLYRLRHALSLETEVIEFDKDRNRYRFNPHVDYEYDVELFLDELAQAELEPNEAERVNRYKTAMSIYRGNYLPEVEGAWVWPERERLWQYYVKTTLRVIEFLFESERFHEALEECYTILSRDETLEEVHRLAMRAQAALGDRPAIERQFERCRAALRREVDVDPSTETFQLYDRLTT